VEQQDVIDGLVNYVGAFLTGVIATLTPVGVAFAGITTTLAILFWGVAAWSGVAGLVPGAMRITGIGAVLFWTLQHWAEIVRGALDAARGAVGLFVGGYGGPSSLFEMASDIFERIAAERVAFSITSPIDSIVDGLVAAIGAFAVWGGLVVTGLLAVLAELELLLGAAIAPLILPTLAFGPTATIGFGAVTWLASAALRVVVLGLLSVLIADGVTSLVGVGGSEAPLGHDQVMSLLALGLLSAVLGLSASSLASAIVRGAPGALGWSSVTRVTGTVSSATAATSRTANTAASRVGGLVGANAARNAATAAAVTRNRGDPFAS
jgi:hypothetical protein